MLSITTFYRKIISQRKYDSSSEINVKPGQIKLHRVYESNGNYHNTVEVDFKEGDLEKDVKK